MFFEKIKVGVFWSPGGLGGGVIQKKIKLNIHEVLPKVKLFYYTSKCQTKLPPPLFLYIFKMYLITIHIDYSFTIQTGI